MNASKKKRIFISFIGIDGSGKTTQAIKLAEAMRSQGIRVKYVWIGWVPTILNPIIKLGKLLLIRRKDIDETNYEDFTMAKKEFFRNYLLAQLWMYYVLFDYAIQIFIKVTIPLLLGRSVICDRYIYDIFVNLSVDYGISYDGVFKLLNSKIPLLFPKPTFTFFLDIPEEIAYARKSDIQSMGYLVNHKRMYLAMSQKLDLIKVDNSVDVELVQKQIRQRVFQGLYIKKEL